MRCLSAWHRVRRGAGEAGRRIHSPPRSYKCPVLRIIKCQVEVGHGESPVGIPDAACAHVHQSTTSLGQDLPPIYEVQFHSLSRPQGLGKNHSDEIISATRQLCALESLVLNELDWVAIRFDLFDLKKS